MLNLLHSTQWIMGMLLYGSGLRLNECLQLRIKDVDFHYNQIFVRDAKGDKDRVTMLPEKVKEKLKDHLKRVKKLHKKDLEVGYGSVYLPDALERKYPIGEKLVCVRYRYDAEKKIKCKTAEIIIEQGPWEMDKKRIPMNKIVNVRVDYGETYLRKMVKEAGGKWNREKGIWQLAYQQVLALGLEKRMIKVPKVSNNRNIVKMFLYLEICF